jgi:spore coat polysaccharide biosynthesis protein SpsF
MRTRAGILLQARLGSTRLPGKALEPVGGYSILERCLRRLIAGGVAHVVLATTGATEDDALAAIAARLGVAVFRGAEHDVLQRLADAAAEFGLDPIVRATGDNPAVDIQAPGRVLAALRCTGADYVVETGLPVGACVEGMTAAALRDAAAAARDSGDREHVTTFIRRRGDRFRVHTPPAPVSLHRPSLRLTIDTLADLANVRELFFRAAVDEPSLAELIAVSGRRPQTAASDGVPQTKVA